MVHHGNHCSVPSSTSLDSASSTIWGHMTERAAFPVLHQLSTVENLHVRGENKGSYSQQGHYE